MNDSSEPFAGPGVMLRRVREQVEVSAAELGRLAGVAPNTILNAERGTTVPSPEHRRAITAALSVLRAQRTKAAYAAVTKARIELATAEAWLDHVEGTDAPDDIWPAVAA